MAARRPERSKVLPEFDPQATRESLDLVRQTVGRYFRMQSIGTENLPRGRCMIVGCHSGVLPYDAALALVAIEDGTGRLTRAIGDQIWGRLGPVFTHLRQRGTVVGDPKAAGQLLREGNLLLVMPGGALDMTRPIWRDPYRVLPHRGFAPGRGGYIKVALATRSPIVPMAVVGAEEAHMMLYSSELVGSWFGVPYFPFVAFPFPLPVKIYVRFGEPIRFREGPQAADNQRVVDRLNERVRQTLQALIDDTRERRQGIIWSSYDASPRAGRSRRRAGRRRPARR